MNNLVKKKYDKIKKENLVNVKKKKYLVISSLDRDWYNLNETSYNYKVKFNDIENSKFTNIQNKLKNIVSIKLEKTILPNKNINITYTSNTLTLDNNPFIIVEVGNVDDVIYGSNDIFNNCLAIMNSLTPILKASSENRYLEFKNLNHSIKEYYENPISNLPNFDIKIKNQQGNDLTNIQDVLTIDNIYANDNNDSSSVTDFLLIKTTTYFGSEYQVGDVIIIKNYIFRDTDTFKTNSEKFNNFINRQEGHTIVALSSTSGSSLSHYNNQISISIPDIISLVTGELSVESWYGDSVGSLIEATSIDNTSSTGDTGGKLINTNLQTNLFINVEYLEKNNLIKSELV